MKNILGSSTVKRLGKIIFFSGMILGSLILISKGKGTTNMIGASMYIFTLTLLGTVSRLAFVKQGVEERVLKIERVKKAIIKKNRAKKLALLIQLKKASKPAPPVISIGVLESLHLKGIKEIPKKVELEEKLRS